jgi:type II secretory pathway predicted ATPase ExeA
MWQHHWRLARDPFSEDDPAYIPTPVHAEAVARLAHAIESRQRLAIVSAGAGLGKSTVLTRALAEVRGPSRRIARASGPSFVSDLAFGLGVRLVDDASRARAWRGLVDAVRLCHWQGLDVILAIDDAHQLVGEADRLDLDRLAHLAPRVTVVLAGRPDGGSAPRLGWELAIRLAPLTRGEAGPYLAAKLASAGRLEPTFTPRAVTRLHALAGGVPRGLDRLASLALLAAADRGLDEITPQVVDGIAGECAPIEETSMK